MFVIAFFRYFFPTFENDTLLCSLEDDEEGDDVQEDDENATGGKPRMTMEIKTRTI